MKARSIFVVLAALFFAGCSSDEDLRATVEKEIRTSLPVGASSETIEHVLKEKKMPYNFNQFESRYEAGIDPKEKRSVARVVAVDIYVDAAKRLVRIEVRNIYTYL